MHKTVIGPHTLYLGDAKEIIPALVKEGLRGKCVVTDPPYLLTSGGPNGVMGGAFDSSRYDNGGHLVALKRIDRACAMRGEQTVDLFKENA